jgi:hypothetical protein
VEMDEKCPGITGENAAKILDKAGIN